MSSHFVAYSGSRVRSASDQKPRARTDCAFSCWPRWSRTPRYIQDGLCARTSRMRTRKQTQIRTDSRRKAAYFRALCDDRYTRNYPRANELRTRCEFTFTRFATLTRRCHFARAVSYPPIRVTPLTTHVTLRLNGSDGRDGGSSRPGSCPPGRQ